MSSSSSSSCIKARWNLLDIPWLYLPSAALLSNGYKTLETRNGTMFTPYPEGTKMLLHVGQRIYPDGNRHIDVMKSGDLDDDWYEGYINQTGRILETRCQSLWSRWCLRDRGVIPDGWLDEADASSSTTLPTKKKGVNYSATFFGIGRVIVLNVISNPVPFCPAQQSGISVTAQ
ncbi:hypothetical protein ACHAXR_009978 [Thalassiosira sp. AJA248-18]